MNGVGRSRVLGDVLGELDERMRSGLACERSEAGAERVGLGDEHRRRALPRGLPREQES